MVSVGRHENIKLLAYSEVESVSGYVGNFDVQVRRKARYIDETTCTGCGQCAEVCPPQAITPGKPPRIDREACIECMCCAEVCPQGAITPRRSLLARLAGLGD